MKIDLNSPAPSQLVPSRSTRQTTNIGNSDLQGLTEDRTTFHSDSVSVQSLTSQAMNSPEIRQSKVDALRQAINNGTHEINPGKIAEAYIASNRE